MQVRFDTSASSVYIGKRVIDLPSDKIVDLPFEEVRTAVKNSLAFYKERLPYNPNSKGKLLFETTIASANGFGYSGQEMLLGLDKYVDLYTTQDTFDHDVPERIKEIASKKLENPDCIGIVSNVPQYSREHMPNEICGIATTFETTRLRPDMVETVNTYDFAIVNAKFMLDTMKDSGVNIPVYYAPLGVNGDEFPYFDRPIRDEFVFGHYGALTIRKGTHIAVEAFRKAFPMEKYPNVKLVVKTVHPFQWWGQLTGGDPRIISESSVLTRKQLVQKLHSWDCLLFPSYGEGFGLPIIESMATGLPVITTGWSAMVDFVQHKKTGLLTDYKLVPVSWFAPEDNPLIGEGAEPNLDSVIENMRWVYEHRKEAKKIGQNAAKDVRKNWTWDRCAKGIVDAMNDYLTNR